MTLLEQNNEVVIFDNLSTGHIETVETLKKYGHVEFQKGDLTNFDDINSVFKNYDIDKVVHFAAFSQVGESVVNPQKYYINNVSYIHLLNFLFFSLLFFFVSKFF